MGYELVYFYREKLENNEYSEDIKEKKIKVKIFDIEFT